MLAAAAEVRKTMTAAARVRAGVGQLPCALGYFAIVPENGTAVGSDAAVKASDSRAGDRAQVREYGAA